MKNKKAESLIAKFIVKSISAEELDKLSLWIESPENELLFKEYIKINYAVDYNLSNFNKEKSKLKILKRIESKNKVVKLSKVLKYAAAIALLVSLFVFTNKDYADKNDTLIVNEILPGHDKAILTLEDGKQIVLEKGNEIITDKVTGNGDELVYSDKLKPKVIEELIYNYLTIPRGGQYRVKLSDGTDVWLNSESKLKYPVNFIEGKTRQVELVYGEAYFDVSPSTNHNGDKFKVLTKNQEVEVLGTEFNIKAYKDENSIYTTLIEGKVRIENDSNKVVLKPNEQSVLNINNKDFVVSKVDVYSEVAWKRGLFSFKNKSLKEIMKVLSRWYDVDVVFVDKKLENVVFKGVLNKNQSIQDILILIKNTNFINDYEIDNNTIILKN
ncbi:FecR family protein [Polaribacter staleyi]|uniref:FecR family protein n=1 Tax=Polaribacter staleyi TaxID=2022337 RepID=UPI0031BA0178